MTPEELDIRLRSHSKHEKLYLQGWQNPEIIRVMKEIVFSGEKLHVVMLSEKQAAISGGKHSRFNAYPVHIHPWVEFNYMYSGSCVQRVNGIPVELKEGQTLLLDQNTVHEIPILGENDILLNIFIRRNYLNADFFNRISQKNIISQFFVNTITEGIEHDSYIFFASERSRRMSLFIKEFFCECFDPTSFSEDILRSLFALIVTELIQCYNEDDAQKMAHRKESSVLPVLKYIEQNYQTATLQGAANCVHLNCNYLSNLLKAQTGSTFHELVCRQRMTQAKKLLLYTQKPVSEIAGDVGYENTTFFYKKFRQDTGITPAEYRQKEGYQ